MVLIREDGLPVYCIDSMNRSLAESILKKDPICKISAGRQLENLSSLVTQSRIKRIGINEESLSAAAVRKLKKCLPHCKLTRFSGKVPVAGMVKKLRGIKTPQEIKIIRLVAKETVRIWDLVRKEIKVGMSEIEVAARINIHINRATYDYSFQPIVASGVNSAFPHAITGKKRIKKEEHVVVDYGIRMENYCSDLTRTWVNGRINRQIRAFRDSVLKAQDLAFREIKPGVKAGYIASKVDDFLKKEGFGEFLLHGLGHGVGLEVHEIPYFRKDSSELLEEGMVVTIEPGLYKTGLGGVRQEDMVLVTKRGCEVLTV